MSEASLNPRGWRIETVTETQSTNTDLHSAGLAGAPDRSVLRAEHQTRGRGRMGRQWESPPGANLLVSFLFREVPPHPHALTQAVALAACAVARDHGVDAVLKWPNDILLDGAKLAGVLAQAGPLEAGRPSFVVVGIGVNIGFAPPGAAALSSAARGRVPAPGEFLVLMTGVIDGLLALDGDELHARYRGALATLGARVRLEMPDGGFLTGLAVDVGTDGRLVVECDDGVTRRLDTADVVHLRPAGDN